MLTFGACNSSSQPTMDNTFKHTNHLIHESSPYLLQHAHNPVNWYPWGDEAFEIAKKENKLVLVSIGYSACHWCHVMEHETFEDEATAEQMNRDYVCIKVDREERPDIDQVYMLAVQLMTGQGGWPLNCITLPDGKPIYGGTYFRNSDWKNVLSQVSTFYKQNPAKAKEYADELAVGVHKTELVEVNTDKPLFTMNDAKAMVNEWKNRFDEEEGGAAKAPKFPLPNNYEFLLHYYALTKDKTILNQVELTLQKMAFGGIYDQLGGGFARYSTDTLWKVPHFEKMLYDNAQLVSLYAKAYQQSKNPLYKQIVYETLEYIQHEMTSSEGGFYSALDADSEKEEGKYYVWTKPELEKLLGNHFALFADYYNVNKTGYWEHDNYILLRKKSDEDIAKLHNISVEQLHKEIASDKKTLTAVREKRVKPDLDDKQLCSWNALMMKGYADAYAAFNDAVFLQKANASADFILAKMKNSYGGLFHNYKNGKATINGYLEDYAFVIEGLLALYQSDLDDTRLKTAKYLMEYTIQHFYDKTSGMFFFTSDEDKALIARKMEINDNVIPASNSSIAKSLFLLAHYTDNADYMAKSTQMLNNVKPNMARYGSGYSNWGILMLYMAAPFNEIAIVGNNAETLLKDLNQQYIPNKLVAGSKKESTEPLLQDRYVAGKTLIYVCENKTCKLPVESVNEMKKLMR
jgi:uncharacterized protein YyaL (SSP411 family)